MCFAWPLWASEARAGPFDRLQKVPAPQAQIRSLVGGGPFHTACVRVVVAGPARAGGGAARTPPDRHSAPLPQVPQTS